MIKSTKRREQGKKGERPQETDKCKKNGKQTKLGGTKKKKAGQKGKK